MTELLDNKNEELINLLSKFALLLLMCELSYSGHGSLTYA